jgi:hypothetical protein
MGDVYVDFHGQKTDFRGQKSDFRDQKSDFRGQKLDFRDQKTDFHGQKNDFHGSKSRLLWVEKSVSPSKTGGLFSLMRPLSKKKHHTFLIPKGNPHAL